MKAADLVIGKKYNFVGNGSFFKVVYEGVRVKPRAYPDHHGFDLVICTDEELKNIEEVN